MRKPPLPDRPNFRNPTFLRSHALWIKDFYTRRSFDPSGGTFHFLLDDGTVYDTQTRHLVTATRTVITSAIAYELSQEPALKEMFKAHTVHVLSFVEDAFFDTQLQGYHWVIHWIDGESKPVDSTRHMYGLAFVMLAAARAHHIGVAGAKEILERAFAIAERRFFEPAHGLYADDASADWRVSDYRGQNANMHACEALMGAFEATGEKAYIERAETLAIGITQRQAALCNGGVWEHYHSDWQPDWEYNKYDNTNIFRPWGYQAGHFTEWAKLLCQLDSHLPKDWHLPRAKQLFEKSLAISWDHSNGGIQYGFDLDECICDPAKYHWVQAESLAASALLALHTGQDAYWETYDRIWQYCWNHFVDHENGAWFRILTAENFNLTREKSPAGKVDYHNMGACYDIWRAMQLRSII